MMARSLKQLSSRYWYFCFHKANYAIGLVRKFPKGKFTMIYYYTLKMKIPLILNQKSNLFLAVFSYSDNIWQFFSTEALLLPLLPTYPPPSRWLKMPYSLHIIMVQFLVKISCFFSVLSEDSKPAKETMTSCGWGRGGGRKEHT